MLSRNQKQFLLNLARKSISDYFDKGKKVKIDAGKIDKELTQPAATFVTLTEFKQLHGCIGNLIAKKPLYEDVINNALLAAFADNRFPQVNKNELKDIKIEISILSEPTPYENNSPDELLNEINQKKHGIIIQNGFNQATYLPQVWDDVKDKTKFLESLCLKAGLPKDSWEEKMTEIFHYTVEKFSEK